MSPCHKVVETVFANMALKKIFTQLGEVFRPEQSAQQWKHLRTEVEAIVA